MKVCVCQVSRFFSFALWRYSEEENRGKNIPPIAWRVARRPSGRRVKVFHCMPRHVLLLQWAVSYHLFAGAVIHLIFMNSVKVMGICRANMRGDCTALSLMKIFTIGNEDRVLRSRFLNWAPKIPLHCVAESPVVYRPRIGISRFTHMLGNRFRLFVL